MSHVVVATAYGGPEVLVLVEEDLPAPGPGQVVLEVRAAGVNPADWKAYSGQWGEDPGQLPLRVGLEAAGVVTQVGPGADGRAVGDELIAFPVRGAYADRMVVDVADTVPKPHGMDWGAAAGLLLTGTTAVHALEATSVGAGDTVLVHGASGGVGAMITQLARLRGARVIGTASPRNHDYLVDLGAAPVAYGEGLADRVLGAAPGGVDAAIDAAGTAEALQTSVALVGDLRRVATLAGGALGASLGVQVLGHGGDPGTKTRRAARHELVRYAEQGRLRVRVGATYHLRDAARAHLSAMHEQVQGKTVLVP